MCDFTAWCEKLIRVFVNFFRLKLGFGLLRWNFSKRICWKCVYYTRNFENQQSCLKTIFITSLVFSWVIRQTSNGFLFPGSAWLAKINMLNWQHTVRLNQAAIRSNKPGLFISEIKAGSFSKRCNIGQTDNSLKAVVVVVVAGQYGNKKIKTEILALKCTLENFNLFWRRESSKKVRCPEVNWFACSCQSHLFKLGVS